MQKLWGLVLYLFFLVADILMELISIPLAFVLPFFAHKAWLPKWLSWFQTPDNSLRGDYGWRTQHWQWRKCLPDLFRIYVGYMGWLLRNRAYGFKWSVLAATVDVKAITWTGDPTIKNRDHGKAGVLHVRMHIYWQYKRIWQIFNLQKCVMLNFGWQLDNYISDPGLVDKYPKALFMFSPRITAFRPDPQPAAAAAKAQAALP